MRTVQITTIYRMNKDIAEKLNQTFYLFIFCDNLYKYTDKVRRVRTKRLLYYNLKQTSGQF